MLYMKSKRNDSFIFCFEKENIHNLKILFAPKSTALYYTIHEVVFN